LRSEGAELELTLLPIFLKLDGRPGLLVGAGNVALEKSAACSRPA
jgi:siroheme synthase (precorrin-2 oxidase/ferrochelatase)